MTRENDDPGPCTSHIFVNGHRVQCAYPKHNGDGKSVFAYHKGRLAKSDKDCSWIDSDRGKEWREQDGLLVAAEEYQPPRRRRPTSISLPLGLAMPKPEGG